MKKPAHLLRGAFYLLLAVCAIPLGLAQRNTTKRGVANAASNPNMSQLAAAPVAPGAGVYSEVASQSKTGSQLLPCDVSGVPDVPRISELPQKVSGVCTAHIIPVPRPPKAPQVVLYDQYDNAGANATFSGTYTDLTGFDADLADDFVVPTGQTWNVESIDADGVYFNGSAPANRFNVFIHSFNVFIYTDNGGLPGSQIFSTTNQPWVQSGSTFTVNLSPAAVLSPGTYWIEIQANMTFSVGGQWGWTDRTVQSNQGAAWRNPGGGFGVCLTWRRRNTDCGIDPGAPDQVYRINGTTGGGGSPTPTPTGTPPACIVVNGDFETGSLPPWTDTGDTSFTAVNNLNPHSGTFSLQAGPTTDDGFIDQVLPTVEGTAYDVSFWLENDDTSSTNRFGASLGGVSLVPEATQSAFGYTLFTFNNVIPGANADLHFIFYNPPSYFYLDDVCVTPSGGFSPTPTPTGSPSCTPIVVNGSIDTGDPTQTDRLFRSGIHQTCAASTSCATFGDGLPRHYDLYTFTNTTGATQCMNIDTNTACTGTHSIFIGAYLGSFDPANICTNWIGDAGSSPNPDQAFQVDVDNGQTLVVVVSEVTPDAGCPGYTVTITGLCGGGGSTPTPTPTPTSTPCTGRCTPTPRPRPMLAPRP
jgi:hypothetical protein